MLVQYPCLAECHTRALLTMLGYTRRFHGVYIDHRGDTYTVEQIKAELSKREHIPNKQEARRIRQEKAKLRRCKQNVKCKQNW